MSNYPTVVFVSCLIAAILYPATWLLVVSAMDGWRAAREDLTIVLIVGAALAVIGLGGLTIPGWLA